VIHLKYVERAEIIRKDLGDEREMGNMGYEFEPSRLLKGNKRFWVIIEITFSNLYSYRPYGTNKKLLEGGEVLDQMCTIRDPLLVDCNTCNE
jgi:hypothetical protein